MNTITYQSEWIKFLKLIVPSVNNKPWLLAGMQNVTTSLENNLAVSYKFKQISTILPSITSPSYLPNRKENLRSHNVHSFIHNHQNWKQPRCPYTGEWIDKLGYMHIKEYYSTTKTNKILIQATPLRNLKCIILGERS